MTIPITSGTWVQIPLNSIQSTGCLTHSGRKRLVRLGPRGFIFVSMFDQSTSCYKPPWKQNSENCQNYTGMNAQHTQYGCLKKIWIHCSICKPQFKPSCIWNPVNRDTFNPHFLLDMRIFMHSFCNLGQISWFQQKTLSSASLTF